MANRTAERRGLLPGPVLLLTVALLYAALLAAARWQQPTERFDAGDIAGVLLFLGFLPLLNAVADWLSTGLTRALLWRGTTGSFLVWAGLDLLGGAAVLVGLGTALIATVWLVQVIGAPPLLDLATLLGPADLPGSILADPHAFWWLYATFLSTLLPTVLHFLIAGVSLAVHWPGPLRRLIAGGIERGLAGHAAPARLAVLALSALIAAAVTVTLAALWYLGLWLVAGAPHLGEALIALFRWIATVMGAV